MNSTAKLKKLKEEHEVLKNKAVEATAQASNKFKEIKEEHLRIKNKTIAKKAYKRLDEEEIDRRVEEAVNERISRELKRLKDVLRHNKSLSIAVREIMPTKILEVYQRAEEIRESKGRVIFKLKEIK